MELMGFRSVLCNSALALIGKIVRAWLSVPLTLYLSVQLSKR
jgi:hypothetical protein